jgi:hypothetical protein
LRVLFSFYWCRRQWGQGYWGALERDWRRLYPLSSAPRQVQETLRDYERYIPTVSRVFFEHRFRQTERRPLSALFPLDAIHPRRLHRIAKAGVARRILQFGGLSPCAQLAVFRTMKDFEMVSAEGLDNLMSRWLKRLAARKRLECLPARKHYPIWSMEERRECLRKHAKNTSRSSLRLPKRSLQSRL